jgi:hypothetical protein
MMAEKTESKRERYGKKIPEDARKHFKAARDEFHKSMEGVLPSGLKEHHTNARKEMMLAFRSLIDASLERMDKKTE